MRTLLLGQSCNAPVRCAHGARIPPPGLEAREASTSAGRTTNQRLCTHNLWPFAPRGRGPSPPLKSKAPSAIRPNDCNHTTRHAPGRASKMATHRHNEEGQSLQRQSADRQHQISYTCTRNGWLRRVRKRMALLRKHNPSAALAEDEKLRRGKIVATFLNRGTPPTEFSPGTTPPPPRTNRMHYPLKQRNRFMQQLRRPRARVQSSLPRP